MQFAKIFQNLNYLTFFIENCLSSVFSYIFIYQEYFFILFLNNKLKVEKTQAANTLNEKTSQLANTHCKEL